MANYDFKAIEEKWINSEVDYHGEDLSGLEKKYVLVEFPYPSGEGLHVGHAFSMTGADVYARFMRKMGKNVMFPMGYDAFGLPSENYAIKTGIQPQVTTDRVTKLFRKQMNRMAFSFDWEREVNTTLPNYYKWTQWIFIKLFEKGLAYKEEMPINWCPSCKIGLANEEVLNGNCERCGSVTEKRNISQWVVKITDYADRLVEGLKDTDFIEKVKAAQVNWIGKKEGAKIKFKIAGDQNKIKEIEVFTTRPDTIFGSTFLVVAPEHPLVKEIVAVRSNEVAGDEVLEYLDGIKGKTEIERTDMTKEKTGVFSGVFVINPANKKEIPVWIADYVLMGYGTGAIMAVPAHDERDFDFAQTYCLNKVPVVLCDVKNLYKKPWMMFEVGNNLSDQQKCDAINKSVSDGGYYDGHGIIANSGVYDGLKTEEAAKRIVSELNNDGNGSDYTTFHLRDWIFSRQHYWGEPIPMVWCEKDHWVTVPEDQLPIVLPEVEKYQPTDMGESPLANITDWVKTTCPKCGGEAKRETDTMPNWAGSDWYFLRYCDNKNENVLADMEKMKYWLPVDVYVGGDEHNTLHLLYSRFIYQFLWDLGAVPKEHPEPYKKRLSHGVILAPDGKRMSKSKGNVIAPEAMTDKYGTDVVRTYMMFMGPFDATMAWNERSLIGVKRFIEKFYNFVILNADRDIQSSRETKVLVNKLINFAEADLSGFKFNTVIARLMETLNSLSSGKQEISKEDMGKMVLILSVFAPIVTEELWQVLGNSQSVHKTNWPICEKEYLVEEKINLSVQINGKLRGVIEINSDSEEGEVTEQAKRDEKINKYLSTGKIIKVIYIKGRTINFVVV